MKRLPATVPQSESPRRRPSVTQEEAHKRERNASAGREYPHAATRVLRIRMRGGVKTPRTLTCSPRGVAYGFSTL